MKTASLTALFALAALAAFAPPISADVYSNAFYWARGIGNDFNGSGALTRKKQRDSLNRQTQFSDTTSEYGSRLFGDPRFTNELVRLPYRGVERSLQCVYFHQAVTITDPDAGTGQIKVVMIKPPTSVRNAFKSDNFTIALRVRPDLEQIRYGATLLRIGGSPSKQTGFWMNLLKPTTNIVGNATNYLSRLWFYYGDKDSGPSSSNCAVALGDWNDIVISVSDKTNATIFVSRGGNLWGGSSNSNMANWQSNVTKFTTKPGYILPTESPNDVILGGWDYDGDDYRAWNAQGTGYGAYSHSLFRGSVQSLAVWTNALTVAQMREAAAWPRTDLWRVGVEDGAANEFNGSGASSTVDVDADFWMLQKTFAAGATATFRFPLDAVGEAKAPQLLRVKAATDSATGTISVSVNGTALKDKPLEAGNSTLWFVPETLLQGGAMNTIVLTRTDAGSSPVKFDAVSFGGTLQYGLDDGHWWEYAEETKIQNSEWCEYNMIGGNWLDGSRALYRAGSGADYTSTTLKFTVPGEIVDEGYRWGLKFKMLNTVGSGHRAGIVINGTSLGDFTAGEEHDVRVPKGLVQSTGNQLTVSNVSSGGASGDYMSPDYVRLYLRDLPPANTVLILR